MRFQDLGLLPELVSNAGYDAPTPVQSESIPAILNGRDVLAGAQTGTGKTAAFILPVMQKLYAGESKRSPRGLVLAPTRELAAQVADSARRYGKGLGLKQTSIFGGVSYGGQLKALRSGLDLVIATPGRLIDHLNQGSIDLSNVQTLILDEADRMLDMGFVRDIERIISKCHGKRQTLLFSATYNKGIKRLASKYLDNPIEVAVARENTVSESVEQTFVHVDQHRKRELLTQLIGLNDMHQVLVFTKTKFGADRLARALTGDGLPEDSNTFTVRADGGTFKRLYSPAVYSTEGNEGVIIRWGDRDIPVTFDSGKIKVDGAATKTKFAFKDDTIGKYEEPVLSVSIASSGTLYTMPFPVRSADWENRVSGDVLDALLEESPDKIAENLQVAGDPSKRGEGGGGPRLQGHIIKVAELPLGTYSITDVRKREHEQYGTMYLLQTSVEEPFVATTRVKDPDTEEWGDVYHA